MKLNYKAFGAEFIGTLTLTLAVLLSLNNPAFPVPTPVLAALTVGIFVYTVGKYSGTHINPAVTIGLLSAGKMKAQEAAAYIVAQIAGAFVGFVAGSALIESTLEPGVVENSFRVGMAEALGAFILTFGIAAVVTKTVPSELSGLVIGGSLLLGIGLASIASGGILNPAVAGGIESLSWAYVWGPILGGIVGINSYLWLDRLKGK